MVSSLEKLVPSPCFLLRCCVLVFALILLLKAESLLIQSERRLSVNSTSICNLRFPGLRVNTLSLFGVFVAAALPCLPRGTWRLSSNRLRVPFSRRKILAAGVSEDRSTIGNARASGEWICFFPVSGESDLLDILRARNFVSFLYSRDICTDLLARVVILSYFLVKGLTASNAFAVVIICKQRNVFPEIELGELVAIREEFPKILFQFHRKISINCVSSRWRYREPTAKHKLKLYTSF